MPDPIKISESNRVKLDGIVQKMVQNNESDENIKFVVEDFKSKYAEKKNSISTSVSPKQNSVSPTKTTSSGSDKKFSKYVDDRLADKYMEENESKPYTPAKPLKKTESSTEGSFKPIIKPEKSFFEKVIPDAKNVSGEAIYDRFKTATVVSNDEVQKAKTELDAEIKGEGIWNTTKNAAKTFWNNAIADQIGDDAKADLDPLADEKKEILKKNPKISKEELQVQAYQTKLDKKVQSLKQSKATDFLADAQNTTYGNGVSFKDELLNTQKKTLKKVDEDLLISESWHKVYQDKAQANQVRLIELDAKAKEFNKKGLKIPEELITEFNELQTKQIEVLKEGELNYSKVSKLAVEKGNLDYNVDLFKRDFSKWGNFTGRLGSASMDMISGGAGAVAWGLDVKKTILGSENDIDKGTRVAATLISKSVSDTSKESRERLIKPISVDDINSANDFGRWFAYNVGAEQIPILAATMIPTVGIGVVGASALGQKYTDIQSEKGENPTNSFNELVVPMLYGGAETVGAYVDKLIMGRAGNIIKSASSSERTMIAQGMATEFFKSTGKSMAQEVTEETGTQIFQNFLDKKFLGKDVNLLDGTKDAAFAALALTGAMNTPGGASILVKKAVQPFTYDSKIQKLSESILGFEKLLDQKNLTDSERAIIGEKLDKVKKESEVVLNNKIKDISNLSNEEYSEILRLEKAQANIRGQVLEIRNSDNLTQEDKTRIEGVLEQEFKANDTRRVDLLKLAKEGGRTSETTEPNTTDAEKSPSGTDETTETTEPNTVETKIEDEENYNPDEDLEFLEGLEIEEDLENESGGYMPINENILPSTSETIPDEANLKKENELSTQKHNSVDSVKNINLENNSETESYSKEITQGKGTYNVVKDEKGNFIVNNSKTEKIIPEFIQRKVKNGFKTVKNPIYSKVISLAEGNLTENQINEENKVKYTEALNFFEDSITTAHDAVLLAFANGLNISRASIKKEANQKIGGVHWTNNSVAENKLPSITQAAHNIWENHFGINSEITDQDIRNEIIDVISSFGSRKDIQDNIIERYSEQTDPTHNLSEKELFDDWFHSLTEEEKNFYNSKLDIELAVEQEQNLSIEEQIEFYNNLYDKTTKSLTETERGEFYGGVQTESELSENVRFLESSRKEQKNEQEVSSLDLATDEELQILVQDKKIIDKIIAKLNGWDNDLTQFSKETLGVALPLVVAKGVIKSMKLAAQTAKAADVIIQAGLDHLKSTDWYKNLNKEDQKKINLRSLKNLVAETIRDIKKAESNLEKTEQKLSDIRQMLVNQKSTRKEVINSVTDFLKNNKVNKNITPTEVNRLINEASKILSKADPLKAFDQFVTSYNKIISKGEQRDANKLRDKTEPNRSKVIRNIERQIAQGKANKDIVEAFTEGSSARMVAEDYFDRKQKKSDDEIRNKIKKLNDDYLNKRHEKKPITEQLKKTYVKFIEAFFDRAHTVKNVMNDAGMKYATSLFIATKGAPGYANYLFEKAYNEIFEGLSTKQTDSLNTIIRLRRIIAIENDTNSKGKDPMVHASNFNLEQASQALNVLEQDLGSEEYNNLKDRADKFFKQQQDLLTEMHKAGVLSNELYNDLKGIEYIKTRYLDFLSEVEENSFKLEQGASTNTGLVRLSDGWNGTVEMNAAELLAQSIQTATRAIASNRLNLGFVNEFQKNKAKNDSLKLNLDLTNQEKKSIDDFKNIDEKILLVENVNSKTPKGFTKITYFENGEQKVYFMEDTFYKTFSDNVASIWGSGNVKDNITTLSGNKILKAVATGKNPTFFITNTPRDFFWIAATSNEYSKLVPLAWAQLAKDFIKGSLDVSNDKISYQKAVEYGLLMDFLHLQGDIKFNFDPRTKLAKSIKAIGNNKGTDVIKFLWEKGMLLGKYSEVGFRMAVFNKATRNALKEFNKNHGTSYKSVEDIDEKQFPTEKEKIYTNAVVESRESSVDFNQGGYLSKDIEALIPYFNAGTQGTRMLAEKIAKDPIRMTTGILQTTGILVGSTVALSLQILNSLKDDDDDRELMELYNEFYSGVSQFDRANYMVIPIGKDDGEYRYTRIAIPQALTPFFSFSRGVTHDALNAMRGIESKSYTFNDTQFSLDKNVIPFELSSNPIKMAGDNFSKIPTLKSAMSYVTGYDFFREQQVSNKFGKVDPSAEGYESKSIEGFYKEFGYQTGTSPARLKVATEALITTPSTNVAIGGAYGVLNTLFSKDSNDKSFGDLALKSFGGRVMKTTSDFNRKASNTDEFKDAKAKNDVENTKAEYEAKSIVDKFHTKEISRKEAFDGIKKAFGDDNRRIKNYKERLNQDYSKYSGNAQEIKFADADKKGLLLKTYFGKNLFIDSKLDEKQKVLKKELIRLKVITESTRSAYRKEVSLN